MDQEQASPPANLGELLAAFARGSSDAGWWSRWPEVPPHIEDDLPACGHMSERFTDFCIERGVDAHTVKAQPANEFHDIHYWTVVSVPHGPVNVDWTARQWFDADDPPAERHSDLPCPLVWDGDRYPIDGVSFLEVTRVTERLAPFKGWRGADNR